MLCGRDLSVKFNHRTFQWNNRAFLFHDKGDNKNCETNFNVQPISSNPTPMNISLHSNPAAPMIRPMSSHMIHPTEVVANPAISNTLKLHSGPHVESDMSMSLDATLSSDTMELEVSEMQLESDCGEEETVCKATINGVDMVCTIPSEFSCEDIDSNEEIALVCKDSLQILSQTPIVINGLEL